MNVYSYAGLVAAILLLMGIFYCHTPAQRREDWNTDVCYELTLNCLKVCESASDSAKVPCINACYTQRDACLKKAE